MAYRWTLTNLSDNTTEVLTKDPIGWEEGTYKISRSERYKGAFHEYTTSLKFHCSGGGKEFIDNIYRTEDIDGRISVLIEYDCDGSGTYSTLTEGIINLASYKEDGEYTYVNIEKSDLLTKLMSRSEISVDLETATSIGGAAITPITATTVPLTPIDIEYRNEWVIESGYSSSDVMSNTYPHTQLGFFTPLGSLIRSDFKESNPMSADIMYEEDYNYGINNINNRIPELIRLVNVGYNAPITLDWSIDYSGTWDNIQTVVGQTRDVDSLELILYKGKRTDPATTFTVVDTLYSYNVGTSTDITNEAFNVVDNGTVSLDVGEQLYLVWVLNMTLFSGACTIFQNFNYNRSTFTISGITTFNETDCKTVLVHEALNAVVDAIADSDNNFDSDFYGREDSEKVTYAQDGEGSLIAISNGLNIRQFTAKSIFCSLDELFDSLDCLHNIGLGIVNDKVKVEPLSYWFNNTQTISLPNVPKFETKNVNNLYYNKIFIGYQRWETEFNGGLDEPCAKQEYSTKVASVKNTYNKLCKYIASSYAWELTRRKNVLNSQNEDFTYDNENFILALTKYAYGYYNGYLPEIYSDAFNNGTGMDNIATAYNLRLTPKRMLLAHLNKFTSGLQIINGNIEFVTGEGNTALQVAMNDVGVYQEDFNGQILGENDSIAWDESNAANISPIWLPEIYSFEYPLTFSQFTTIKNSPYGYISFYKFSDDVKSGYIMNMEYSMKTGLTKFELLRRYVS